MLHGFARKVSLSMFLLLFAMVFAACNTTTSSPPAGEQPGEQPKEEAAKPSLSNIVATTNPSGAEYYTISVAQSEILNKYSGIKVTVQPATGSVAQFQAVKADEAQFGMSTAQGLVDAWGGEKSFAQDGAQTWVRALMCGSNTLFGIVTREDTGIKTIADLKGKRVTFQFPADLTARFTAQQELVAFGLDPEKDVKPQVAEFTQKGFEDLKEGNTDAAIGALKNPTLLEVATVSPLVVLPFPADKISVVQEQLPGMFACETDGVSGMDDGIPVVGSPAVLYSHQQLPDDVAYLIVKTLLDNYDELVQKNESLMKYWSVENAIKDFGVPYHPGAIKYFKEIGIWTDEMQAKQDELLSKVGS